MGLFGLFGKKKKNQPQTQSNPTATGQPQHQQQQQTNPNPQQQLLQTLPKPTKVTKNNQDDPDVITRQNLA